MCSFTLILLTTPENVFHHKLLFFTVYLCVVGYCCLWLCNLLVWPRIFLLSDYNSIKLEQNVKLYFSFLTNTLKTTDLVTDWSCCRVIILSGIIKISSAVRNDQRLIFNVRDEKQEVRSFFLFRWDRSLLHKEQRIRRRCLSGRKSNCFTASFRFSAAFCIFWLCIVSVFAAFVLDFRVCEW